MRDAIESFILEENIEGPFTIFAGDFNSQLPDNPHADASDDETDYSLPALLLERLKQLYKGRNWWKSLREVGYKSSYHELNRRKVFTHIAHTYEYSECDFIFYKGDGIPTNSFLEPSAISHDLKILRPTTESSGLELSAATGKDSNERFLQEWAKISDHRPKTTIFDLNSRM
mmetsp:Transcript_10180/g.12252  ORF Transcript_10180/g.12252 Transcript_10180/m.12252 type:complete len:172 (+) Transcript_10180:556-1071(+)